MVEKQFKQSVYSLSQTARIVGCSYRRLYLYQKKHIINCISWRHEDTIHFGVDQHEFQRIRQYFMDQKKLITVKEFAKQNHVSYSKALFWVNKLHLKPVDHRLSPQQKSRLKYFNKNDMEKINKIWQFRNAQVRYIPVMDFKPTTDHIYDQTVDYTIYTLCPYLNPNDPPTSKIVKQWIQTKKVPYSIDPNFRMFFTKEQAQAIKDRYKNIPETYICNTQELAKRLNTYSVQIINLKKRNHIEGHKVLGTNSVFYTAEEVKILTNSWHQINHPKPIRKD